MNYSMSPNSAAPGSFMDSPAWKKWPFHLQNVSSLLGRLAGTAAIQGQLLPF